MCLLIALVFVPAVWAQIPTFCGDNTRTCSNTSETILKPSTLGQVGLLGEYSVTGQIYAQPLIATGVSTAAGTKDLLIAATMQGYLYAFDANAPGSAPVWSIHLNSPRTSFTAPRGGESWYNAPLGCMATPVVDASFAYAVCAGPAANANATWTLYKVALKNGSLAQSVVIAGSVKGTGSGGTTVTFDAEQQLLRSALLLSNGKVYIAFGSYADQDPWFGWIFAYDTATLTRTAITNASPNDRNVGFWMSGGGPAADASGNLYVMTSNTLTGIYNPPTDLTESFVKYDPSLRVLDYFTPADHTDRDINDWDLGSSWPMLVGNLVVGTGKRNTGYAVLANNMGHLQGGGTAPQVFTKANLFTDCVGCGTFGSAAYMNGRFYFANKGGFQGENKIFMLPLFGSTIAKVPTSSGADSFACCGAQMFGSSNGISDGILWALTPDTALFKTMGTGTLRAYDPVTLAEIYTGPSIGNMPKFMHPVVWNGRVYVATLDGSVLAFGIKSASAALTSLQCTPQTLSSGQQSTCTVSLNTAPGTPTAVSISSGNPAVTVPSSVTIVADVKSATFSAAAGTIASNTTAMLAATDGTQRVTSTLNLMASAGLSSLQCTPQTLSSGQQSTCTVSMNTAPASPTVVSISSGNAAVTVPSSVTILAGVKSATFTAAAGTIASNATATLSAKIGTQQVTTSLNLTAAATTTTLSSLQCTPQTLSSGQQSACMVSINAVSAAPTAVSISSGNAAVTVPSSVTILAGVKYASFTAAAGAIASSTTATLSAKIGTQQVTTSLNLMASAALTSLKCTPQTLSSGQQSTCMVGISMVSGTPTAVSISSGNAAVTVPSSVTILAGVKYASFTAAAGTIASNTTATLSAKMGTQQVTYTLNLTGSATTTATLTSLQCTPQTLSSGQRSTCTVSMNIAPGTSTVVSISSGNAVITVPSSVTILAGVKSATFTAAAGTIASNATATLSATSGTQRVTTSLNLTASTTPPAGSLTGAVATPTTVANLTSQGLTDWVHWGTALDVLINRKAGVAKQISPFTVVGGGTATRFTNNTIGFAWSDGTPMVSTTSTTTGVYISGQNKGFSITAPADSTTRTLLVYVGANQAQGRMVAQLSDGSAPVYTDTSIGTSTSGMKVGVYAFTYNAASAGQTLIVTFTQASTGTGNVMLQSAALWYGTASSGGTSTGGGGL